MRPTINDELAKEFIERFGQKPCPACNGTGHIQGDIEDALRGALYPVKFAKPASTFPEEAEVSHVPECPKCGRPTALRGHRCLSCLTRDLPSEHNEAAPANENEGNEAQAPLSATDCPECGRLSEHPGQLCESCNGKAMAAEYRKAGQ